jgi:hypothetical protein
MTTLTIDKFLVEYVELSPTITGFDIALLMAPFDQSYVFPLAFTEYLRLV